MFSYELAVGQLRAFHLLFNQDPVLAIIVIVALIAIANYMNKR